MIYSKAPFRRNQLRSLASIVLLSLFLISLPASGEIVEQIVAVVNDEVITYSELERVLVPLYQKYEEAYSGTVLFTKLQSARWSILNQLIEEKLILQAAREKEVDIDEAALMERMEEVESRFSSSEEFQRQLARSDMTLEEFREMEREKLIAYSMLMDEISRRVLITPQNIISYYNEHKGEYSESEKVHLYQVFIKKGGGEKRELAEKVLERLEAGEDFKELAKAYSDGPEKDDGGDWGFIERGYLNPETMGELEKIAFELGAGDHSGIIETSLGYHIISVEAVQKARTIPVSELWDGLEQKLGQEEAEKAKDTWISELKKNAYISIKQ